MGETLKLIAGSVVGGLGLAQWSLGSCENEFFDYRFNVKADPADLSDFFGTEAAMEAYSVFPFVTNFLMRRGAWDDEGTYRVPILLGDYLSARMEFEEREQNPKELTPLEVWDTFMTKSVKPGEDDDDDDEDEDDDDDDDDEDDEEDDEEGDEEEEGAEAEGGDDADDSEEKDAAEEKGDAEEKEEVTEEPATEASEEDKPVVAVKRTSNGGLWVWISSRFKRKNQEPAVLEVALDLSEVKEEAKGDAEATEASEETAVVASEEGEEEEEGDEEGDEDEDEDEEEEEDEGPKCEFFVKKETLRLVEGNIKKSIFHYELEMGFNLLPNGECEIFYRGTKFRGLFVFRIVFELHALYFMWAMERYFNSSSFCISDLAEEAEHYRLNIPIGAMQEYLYNLIKDVEKSREVAKSKNLATKEHEKNIEEIKSLLSKAGYMGAEAVLVDAENGKQQIMLNISDEKAKAIIQRALTFNSKAKAEAEAAQNTAGVALARRMTMRMDEIKDDLATKAAA